MKCYLHTCVGGNTTLSSSPLLSCIRISATRFYHLIHQNVYVALTTESYNPLLECMKFWQLVFSSLKNKTAKNITALFHSNILFYYTRKEKVLEFLKVYALFTVIHTIIFCEKVKKFTHKPFSFFLPSYL